MVEQGTKVDPNTPIFEQPDNRKRIQKNYTEAIAVKIEDSGNVWLRSF